MSLPVIHVACGVLVNVAGEVLVAQRPKGKIADGYWEFPGGKIEPGESARQALVRELREELGVEVQLAEPLIRFSHQYSNRRVVLDTWRITAFSGTPESREGQALQWCPPAALTTLSPCLPTVAPIAALLTRPAHYVFTPPMVDADWTAARLDGLPKGCWLRLRLPGVDDAAYRIAARTLLPMVRRSGRMLFLDRAAEDVRSLGADGWHATGPALTAIRARPDVPLAIASVHDAESIAAAVRLGFDGAVLGPVLPTATHPGARSLGWEGFGALRGEAALGVHAIGGLGPDALADARRANAQGVAGISAYWRD